MSGYDSEYNKSEFDDIEDDPLPIKDYLLTDTEIMGVFPNFGENDIEKIKEILLLTTEIIYKNGKN
jgi:hypothetical protein